MPFNEWRSWSKWLGAFLAQASRIQNIDCLALSIERGIGWGPWTNYNSQPVAPGSAIYCHPCDYGGGENDADVWLADEHGVKITSLWRGESAQYGEKIAKEIARSAGLRLVRSEMDYTKVATSAKPDMQASTLQTTR
jgi:hypothetical protein